jgi:uncharacterized protein involved in outer membrane biogenesis
VKRWHLIGGGVLAGLLLMVIAVLFFLVSSLDSLIKAAVEKYGSEITRVEVRLKEAEVSVTSGRGALRGLSVGNPKGFQTPGAFRLGEISLTLDLWTLTQDTIVIKEIVISAPEVTYEIGARGSNIDTIRRNVDTSLGKTQGKNASGGGAEGGPRLVIENLYVRNGKVNVNATMLQGKQLNASLPDIHLTGIGKQKGGAAPGEVIQKIVVALGQSTGKAVSRLNLDNVLDTAKETMAETKQTLEKSTRGVEGTLKKLFGN